MADQPEPPAGFLGVLLTSPEAERELAEAALTEQEVEHPSDRVCAIVMASWLEGRLQHAISWRLADSKYQRGIFKNGMLAAYEPKVQLGYLIKIYGEEARENL